MTVWAKLQSWIGAVASGLNLDNEFNNIYTGLNESQNGSIPDGYNNVRLTYTTDQLTVKGISKVYGVNVNLNSTITVTGATGWRYIVSTNGGVISVETIPGAEITANTIAYTPTPVYNPTHNGYYSTVNTTRRILGVLFYNSGTTSITKVYTYGNGYKKNDDFYDSVGGADGGADAINDAGHRMQYTQSFDKMHGTNITAVDQGAGTTDSDGFKVTANRDGKITIKSNIFINNLSAGDNIIISINKNGALFKSDISKAAMGAGLVAFSMIDSIEVEDKCATGDYYTFFISSWGGGSSSATLNNVQIFFDED